MNTASQDHKPLGSSTSFIPAIGIGTWEYRAGPEILRAGLEAGALFIDTAESYGSEEVVGQAIRGVRERVFLATKASPEHFHRQDLIRSAEESLRRLRTDYIDLYQLHRPSTTIPLSETLEAMVELLRSGKILHIGVSNFSVSQLDQCRQLLGDIPVASNQVRYNLIDRTIERDMLSYCTAHRISIIAYSPLARGLSHLADADPKGSIDRIASETGHTKVQVALNWCLCPAPVVAIPKGNSVEHVVENCGAAGWRLTMEQRSLLDMSVLQRCRTPVEEWLRRCAPASLKGVIRSLAGKLPRSVRRLID
jgi:diketogulonate reductase-like aldo/keto reductase